MGRMLQFASDNGSRIQVHTIIVWPNLFTRRFVVSVMCSQASVILSTRGGVFDSFLGYTPPWTDTPFGQTSPHWVDSPTLEQTPPPWAAPPPRPQRRPLQRTVRILLECILVLDTMFERILKWGWRKSTRIEFRFDERVIRELEQCQGWRNVLELWDSKAFVNNIPRAPASKCVRYG